MPGSRLSYAQPGGHGVAASDDRSDDFLTASEAVTLLAIKPSTLYTYVSRGWIHAIKGRAGEGKRYSRADVERLKARAVARSGHGPAAGAALRWGEPLLETTITVIEAGGPIYRSREAVALAASGCPFEAVAVLLWSGVFDRAQPQWSLREIASESAAPSEAVSPLALLFEATMKWALGDLHVDLVLERGVAERARRLIVRWLGALAHRYQPRRHASIMEERGVARIALLALSGTTSAEAERALNAALILVADHELAASTFAARVAASTGAGLYACVAAALATFSGPHHGGACAEIERFLASGGDGEGGLSAELRRAILLGETVPGFFYHPLYPKGDPRARCLVRAALEVGSGRPRMRLIGALIAAMEAAQREPPSTEFGLVALAMALEMPAGSAACLWAIARSAGWMAHVLEQRATSFIRPRACLRKTE